MKRQTISEVERAQAELARLAEQEQPTLDPGVTCSRCFGTGREQYKDEDGYNTVRDCDHLPVPF